MEKVSVTTLRQNLFRLVDKVIKTGMPLVIKRKGKSLILAPETATAKLSRLRRRRLVKGKPEALVNMKVGEWREVKNLARPSSRKANLSRKTSPFNNTFRMPSGSHRFSKKFSPPPTV